MNYNGYKEMVKIDGKKYTAFFPNRHTTVKGIIYSYERWDENAGDPWANITRWKEHIILYVLWKGHVKWEKIVCGGKNTSDYRCYSNSGTADILFQMETKEKQKKISLSTEKKEIKIEIKELEKKLKEITKELGTIR